MQCLNKIFMTYVVKICSLTTVWFREWRKKIVRKVRWNFSLTANVFQPHVSSFVQFIKSARSQQVEMKKINILPEIIGIIITTAIYFFIVTRFSINNLNKGKAVGGRPIDAKTCSTLLVFLFRFLRAVVYKAEKSIVSFHTQLPNCHPRETCRANINLIYLLALCFYAHYIIAVHNTFYSLT